MKGAFMRRFLIAAVFVAALPAFAGVSYKFQSVSTGMQSTTIAGTVQVEGPKMRLDFTSGDGMLFKSDSILLSTDGGKTLQVFDPTTKTYFEIPVDQLLGGATSALKNLGAMMKISFDNPQATAKDEGEGGTIEGYPTRKSQLDASFDINIDMSGQKMNSHMSLSTERWTTDKIAVAFINVFQAQGLHTGFDAVDKLIDAQESVPKGFPLKQVSTIHVKQGANDLTAVSTSTVTDVQTKTIPAATFVAPEGYSKTESPLDRVMKQMKM
jgi:hypothetical protein